MFLLERFLHAFLKKLKMHTTDLLQSFSASLFLACSVRNLEDILGLDAKSPVPNMTCESPFILIHLCKTISKFKIPHFRLVLAPVYATYTRIKDV